LIEEGTGIGLWQSSICFKPTCEGGGMTFTFSNNVLAICILLNIKDNPLLIRKMDLEANHIGVLLLHVKEIETPHSLTAADVPGIEIL
jgi:hypothetical protein